MSTVNSATAQLGCAPALWRKSAIAMAVAMACASSAMSAESAKTPADEGLSEVTVEQIEAARKIVEISTVQNLYNLANRQSEDVL